MVSADCHNQTPQLYAVQARSRLGPGSGQAGSRLSPGSVQVWGSTAVGAVSPKPGCWQPCSALLSPGPSLWACTSKRDGPGGEVTATPLLTRRWGTDTLGPSDTGVKTGWPKATLPKTRSARQEHFQSWPELTRPGLAPCSWALFAGLMIIKTS